MKMLLRILGIVTLLAVPFMVLDFTGVLPYGLALLSFVCLVLGLGLLHRESLEDSP